MHQGGCFIKDRNIQVDSDWVEKRIINFPERYTGTIDALALIDLDLGGKKRLKSRGLSPHPLIGMQEVIQLLLDKGKLAGDHHKLTLDFLEESNK